jgi:cytochrome c oxidase assembly protein subunit 11
MSQVKHLPIKLCLITLLMFGFGFGLVPLYDVFCEVTGINGKGFERLDSALSSNTIDINKTGEIDRASSTISTETHLATNKTGLAAREITVQFLSQPQAGFSGSFYPKSQRLSVPVEKSIQTMYVARNALDERIHLQAIPSIAPSEAAAHVTKIECFCFQEQYLEAGQQREMSLVFSIADSLPKHIKKITFSYSLYPAITGGHSNEPNT